MTDETPDTFGEKPVPDRVLDPAEVTPEVALEHNSIAFTMTRESARLYGLVRRTREERIEDHERVVRYRAEQAERRAAFHTAWAHLVACTDDPVLVAVLDLHRMNDEGDCDGCDWGAHATYGPTWPCSTIECIATTSGHPLPAAPWEWSDPAPLPPFDPDAEDPEPPGLMRPASFVSVFADVPENTAIIGDFTTLAKRPPTVADAITATPPPTYPRGGIRYGLPDPVADEALAAHIVGEPNALERIVAEHLTDDEDDAVTAGAEQWAVLEEDC